MLAFDATDNDVNFQCFLASKNLAEILTIYICYNYFDFKDFAAPLIKIFFAKHKKSCCLQNSYYIPKLKFDFALSTVFSSSL